MQKLAVLLVLAAVSAVAQTPRPAPPEQYVIDRAGVIDDAREKALNDDLAEGGLDGVRIVVSVDRRLARGTTPEAVARETLRQTGAEILLLLWVDDRISHVEVGPSARPFLTHEETQSVLTGLRGALRKGDYETAAEQGVKSLRLAFISGGVTFAAPKRQQPAVATPAPGPAAAAPEARSSKTTENILIWGILGLVGATVIVSKIRQHRAARAAEASQEGPDAPDVPEDQPAPSPQVTTRPDGGFGATDKW